MLHLFGRGICMDRVVSTRVMNEMIATLQCVVRAGAGRTDTSYTGVLVKCKDCGKQAKSEKER